MNKSEYSPGPWVNTGEFEHDGYTEILINSIQDTSEEAAICIVQEINNPGFRANAHLIKTAPELLEKAQEVLNACFIYSGKTGKSFDKSIADALFNLLFVINKAEGGSE